MAANWLYYFGKNNNFVQVQQVLQRNLLASLFGIASGS